MSLWSPHFSGRQFDNWKPNRGAEPSSPKIVWKKLKQGGRFKKAPQSPAHQLFCWRFFQVSPVGVRPYTAKKLQAAALLSLLLLPMGQVEGNTPWRREAQGLTIILSCSAQCAHTHTPLQQQPATPEKVWSRHIAWIHAEGWEHQGEYQGLRIYQIWVKACLRDEMFMTEERCKRQPIITLCYQAPLEMLIKTSGGGGAC